MSTTFEFSANPRFVWIYNFDEKGLFTGTFNYCIPPHTGLPANCTTEPCQPKSGMAGVWNGQKWHAVPDLRGVEYWDNHGTLSIVLELVDALPEGAITLPPPVPAPGNVLLFKDGAWLELTNKTGTPYYSADGQSHTVPDLWFILPDDCTFTPPGTAFDTWNGTEWVTDIQAQQEAQHQEVAQQQQLAISQAQQQRQVLRAGADQKITELDDAIALGIQQDGDADHLTAWKTYRVLLGRVDLQSAPAIEWPVMP
jgi:hypothetical protein